MKLELIRETTSDICTLGKLYVNGEFFCDLLEDTDRMLDSKMSLEEIAKIKIKTKTAIPTGTYTVVNTFSPRFEQYMPLLLNVPGYSGIRIHPGNTAAHTDGCLLPGKKSGNSVINSRIAYNKLFRLIKDVEKKEKITITITRKY